MIDVLRWEAAPNVLAYRFQDCALTYKSQLIVEEAQEAVLVKEGLYYGPIGPGRHTLETKNFPFLTKLITGASSKFKTPFTASVWFVKKSIPLDIKWGTPDPVLVEDPVYHIALPIRAFGQYGIQVEDSCRFLAKLSGALPAFTTKTLSQFFKGVVATQVKDHLANTITNGKVSILHVGTRLNEISSELSKRITDNLSDFGVRLKLFTVNSISTDEDDPSVVQLRKALAKKAEMSILGFSYEQERSFDTLQTAAGNAGSAGAMLGVGMGLGMGASVGAPMGAAMSNIAKSINPSGANHCVNCGATLPKDAKFCPGCGTKIG